MRCNDQLQKKKETRKESKYFTNKLKTEQREKSQLGKKSYRMGIVNMKLFRTAKCNATAPRIFICTHTLALLTLVFVTFSVSFVVDFVELFYRAYILFFVRFCDGFFSY